MPAVAGLFKYDIAKFRGADDQYYDAAITDIYNDGTVDVAYVKSSGHGNVQMKYEKKVSYRRFNGAALKLDTLLPYKEGDLVRWYLNDDDYYLAHIISVGKVDTVKILLGDVYMGSLIKDRKTGDMMEVNIKDIRYVKAGNDPELSRKEKIMYGYENWELHKDIKTKVANEIKMTLVLSMVLVVFLSICYGLGLFMNWFSNLF